LNQETRFIINGQRVTIEHLIQTRKKESLKV